MFDNKEPLLRGPIHFDPHNREHYPLYHEGGKVGIIYASVDGYDENKGESILTACAADHICHAVNNHHALLDALRNAHNILLHYQKYQEGPWCQRITDTIRRARG